MGDAAAERARHLASRRVQYETAGLDVADVAAEPLEQWQSWYDEAVEAGLTEPNAMTVATVDSDGAPDARIVLARRVDRDGIVFYTNYDSAKSQQIGHQSRVALVFTWLDLHRQVRVRGTASRLDATTSDAYFAGRPRASQLGAWASPQSQPLENRADLEQRLQEATARFEGHDVVPRPTNWGGWLVTPTVWEFWQGRPNRLHDRIRYTEKTPPTRLAP